MTRITLDRRSALKGIVGASAVLAGATRLGAANEALGPTVYLASRDGTLYAVDAVTGVRQWEFDTGRALRASPTVSGGTVYFGSDDENLHAVRATDGTERWVFETERAVRTEPVVADGTVYCASMDGRLYALDAASGDATWDFRTNDTVSSRPTVTEGIVYLGADDGRVYALDRSTGEQQWSFHANGDVFSPAVADDSVYVTSRNNALYALDAGGGDRRWTYRFDNTVIAGPTLRRETVYVPMLNGKVHHIDTDSGERIWRPYDVSRRMRAEPRIVDETMYVASESGYVYTFDLTGQNHESPERLFQARDRTRASPAVVDSMVYVGSDDGALYAIDSETGALQWRFTTGDVVAASPTVVANPYNGDSLPQGAEYDAEAVTAAVTAVSELRNELDRATSPPTEAKTSLDDAETALENAEYETARRTANDGLEILTGVSDTAETGADESATDTQSGDTTSKTTENGDAASDGNTSAIPYVPERITPSWTSRPIAVGGGAASAIVGYVLLRARRARGSSSK